MTMSWQSCKTSQKDLVEDFGPLGVAIGMPIEAATFEHFPGLLSP